jgi:hypothetical protein
MGGSGYRPSRDTVAALYGAVRGWRMLRHKSDAISLPYSNSNRRPHARPFPLPYCNRTIHHRHARLAGESLTVL